MAALTWTIALLAGLACASGLGTPTTIEQYPSLVQIEFSVGSIWLQQCLGTVLTSYHVLSAASCFDTQDPSRIRAGTSTNGVGGQVCEVGTVFKHYSYGLYPALGSDGNLAMLRLANGLVLGAGVQQSAILGQGIELPDGLVFSLAGWGTTAEGGYVGDDDLYSVELVNINNEQCMVTYLANGVTITENMVCGGLSPSTGRDLDHRDIGAGLYYRDALGQVTVIGIVSEGAASAEDQFPIIGTAISSYTSWIVETAAIV